MSQEDLEDKQRLYGEITGFVTITIEGKSYQAPENLELLRCFQYLDFHIAFEQFCWNASCENCAVLVKGSDGEEERTLCCQAEPEEGMVIEKLPNGVTKD